MHKTQSSFGWPFPDLVRSPKAGEPIYSHGITVAGIVVGNNMVITSLVIAARLQ